MKKVKLRWRIQNWLFVVIFLTGMSSQLLVPIIGTSSTGARHIARAEPSSTTQEAGIWVDRFRIVLYNNVLRAESTEEITASDGKKYEVPGAGETFYHPGVTSSDGPTVKTAGPENDRLEDATDDIVNSGGTVVFKNADSGCATLTINYKSAQTATLNSTCAGRALSGINVSLENPERRDIIAYKVSDTSYSMQMYISGVVKNGTQTEDSHDIHITYGHDGTFNKESPDSNPGNTGGAPREYVNCADHECFAQTGTPGATDATWLLRNPYLAEDTDRVVQVRRSDLGMGQGDNSESRYMSGRLIVGQKDSIYDSAVKQTTDYQTRETQKGAFKTLFESNADAIRIANFCYTGSFGAGVPSIDLIINTLTRPIPGPFFSCLKDAFTTDENTPQALKDAFAAIQSIQSKSAAQPPEPVAEGGDCGGGIPIISDIVCNLVKWAFNVIFEMFTAVIDFMTNPPELLSGQDTQMDKIWGSLRNIANILFLISFLLVVFQYITNYNVADAYFIKKFIPRLVIAVILVQASGWITRELMYFFDDLGKSIQAILFAAADIQRGNGFEISGGAATVAFFAGPAIIGLLALFAIIFLVVLVITIIVLAVRYVAILVLAIFAPLAFACLALPQLEGTFKKWLKTYITLLAMYPLIMLTVAACSIIASVLNGGGVILQLMALTVLFIPFIAVPFTFKMAGGILATASAKVMDLGKKGAQKGWNASGTKADLDKYKGMRKQSKDNKSDERVARRLKGMQEGNTRRSKLARKGLMRGIEDGQLGTYAGGFEDRVEKRQKDEAAAAVASKIRGLGTQTEVKVSLKAVFDDAKARGDVHTMSAAYAQLVKNQAEGELREIQSTASAAAIADPNDAFASQYNTMQGENYSELKSFAPHLAGDVTKAVVDPATGEVTGRTAVNLSQMHQDNLANLSNDSLAGVKPEAWVAWAKHDPSAAAQRYKDIKDAAGGAAAKLSPEAVQKMIDTASAADAAAGGGTTHEADVRRILS